MMIMSCAEQSNSISHESHAAAGQAIVLRETGMTNDAVDLLDSARRHTEPASPRMLRSWLAATHGETLTANGDRDEARTQANHATRLATQVGSARLHRRLHTLAASLQ